MESIIRLENVTYYYDVSEEEKILALDNVTLDIFKGEFLSVIGANGSGKSTLAKLLNALYLPKSGNVTVFGLSTDDESKTYDIRSKVGMVFQNPDNQMIASIIEDDIAFGPENLGIAREEIRSRVDWALATVGMSEFAKHTPYKLSGGQKQRISIAAILAMKPKVLVLDESTAMLDPKGRQEVLDVVKKLNKQNDITIVHITHHLEETTFSDRIVALDKGAVVFSGTPLQLYGDELLLKQYGFQLPIPLFIRNELMKRGLPLSDNLCDVNTLAEEICRLL